MRVEVPTFKRCCFCMPLRRGLLFWSYITLIFSIFNIAILAQALDHYKKMDTSLGYETPTRIFVMHSLRMIIYILDIALTFMFIYGAHTKNYKLFRIYYFSIVIITALLFALRVVETIWYIIIYEMGLRFSLYLFSLTTGIAIIVLGMQIYMILLVRSEMIKLGENCTFRFFNFGAEAECTLNSQQEGAFNGRVREQETEINL